MPGVSRRTATAGLALLAAAGPARAEATRLRAAKQYGLGYLQLMIMEDRKLVEAQAHKAGLGEVAVEWATFRSSDVMNDALLSGTLDFVCLGVPGLAIIWSRGGSSLDVRAAAGLNALPLFLNVRDPAVKSVADFKPDQRIAVPAVKVSMQAILLEMAAAKAFGAKEYGKLDALTVSLAHPDATAMMVRGGTEIVANFSSYPFQAVQLKQPGVRTIATSVDILGGPSSFNVVATTGRFRRDNPKLYGAFLAALDEATAYINADKRRAAEDYLRIGKDRTPVEDVMAILNDPQVRFTTDVFNLGAFTDFMATTGAIKAAPKDWTKELVFPEAKIAR